ncbi:MAG: His/Gly/Thr/Pro-type tRNA ligase C-terminal domain-containing protein [Pseudomonadota bacterium]
MATVTEATDQWALEVEGALAKAGLRTETDLRKEKIVCKVQEHALKKVPIQIALGAYGTETFSVAEAIGVLAQEAQPPRGGTS